MRLYLENFRCHSQFQCEFVNGVTLIRGRSGLGKTTIFNAIVWCLYGTSRNKEIKNCKPGKNLDTVVVLDLDDYIIERRNNPMRLIIRFSDRELQEEEAQTFIDNTFGDYKFFLCTSYIMQKDKCKFLTLDTKEKTKVLRKLSLRDEDPKLYIKRIDEYIQGIYDKLKKSVETMNSLQIDSNIEHSIDQTVTQDVVESLSKQVVAKTNELQHALSVDSENRAKKRIIESHTFRLSNLRSQLSLVTKRDLQQLKKQIEELRDMHKIHLKYLEDKQKADKILDKLSSLPQGEPVEDLNKLESQQKEYEHYLRICKKWNIDYTLDAISDRLALLSNRHIYRENENKRKRRNEIEKRLETLPQPSITSEEFGSLMERYKQQIKISKYGLKLDQVEQRIAQIQSLLKQCERKQDYDKSVVLDKKIADLIQSKGKFVVKPIPVDRQKELAEKKQLLDRMVMSVGVIRCPHCNKGVRYVNGILKPETQDVVDPKRLEALRREVQYITDEQNKRTEIINHNNKVTSELQRVESELTKYQALRDQIGEIEAPPNVDVNKLKEELRDLQSITDTTQMIDIELCRKREERGRLEKELATIGEIKNYNYINLATADQEYSELAKVRVVNAVEIDLALERQKLLRKQLESQLATLTLTDVSGTEKLPELEQEYDKAVRENEIYDKLMIEINTIEQTLSEIKIIEVDVESKRSELEDAKRKYEFSRYSLEMLEKLKKFKQLENYVNKLKQSITALGNLKEIVRNVDSKLLEDVTSMLNAKTAETLNYMFNDDKLIVEFNVFKEQKNGIVKPQVNLRIQYKNIDYTDITQLSGGEMDRVSMCVAIALNSLHKTKFMLLDETMSSLDADCRESCVKVLSMMNCPVAVINHEDNDGNYDNVIALN